MSTKNQETFIPLGVGDDLFSVSLVNQTEIEDYSNEMKVWRRAQLPIRKKTKKQKSIESLLNDLNISNSIILECFKLQGNDYIKCSPSPHKIKESRKFCILIPTLEYSYTLLITLSSEFHVSAELDNVPYLSKKELGNENQETSNDFITFSSKGTNEEFFELYLHQSTNPSAFKMELEYTFSIVLVPDENPDIRDIHCFDFHST